MAFLPCLWRGGGEDAPFLFSVLFSSRTISGNWDELAVVQRLVAEHHVNTS